MIRVAMMRSALAVALVVLGTIVVPGARGHQATERYIPIGKSPGLSGQSTYLGTIGDVDVERRTIGRGDTWSATVTAETRVWLDRSKQRKSNLNGTFEDLKRGCRVEVKYVGADRSRKSGPAEWIKIEPRAADAE